MEPHGALVGLLVNLGVPITGIALYAWLWRRMDVEHPSPVVVFLLFAHYGAWLVIILTITLWYWSGMATLGFMYLVTAGTVVMLVLAALTFRERRRSIYHRIVFIASAAYLLPVALVFLYVLLLLLVGQGGSGLRSLSLVQTLISFL